MGAKTALLAFAEADVRPALTSAGRTGRAEAEALVRRVHPGHAITAIQKKALQDCVHPPDDTTYAVALAGVDLVCDRRFALDRPSELPEHLRELGKGRRIVMHAMHSVVDWLAFAVWEDGVPVRSLSLSPDSGVMEDIGDPYEFELPYWSGGHPVVPEPGWPDQDPYPLPFHPLELGEVALRALFGFVVEGYPDVDDVDAAGVLMHGFSVTDPSGLEQAAREAAIEEALRGMGPPKVFRMGPDGAWQESDPGGF
ncbi:DUF6928 family protein [Spirillospora sp. NPDC050679]